jgi:Helix-hairpin-helix domain/Archaeal TRASH domain
MTSCDYCGEEILDVPVTVEAGAWPSPGHIGTEEFHYHGGTPGHDGEPSCYARVLRGLRDLERWAHLEDRDDPRMSWILVERPAQQDRAIPISSAEWRRRWTESDISRAGLPFAQSRALIDAGYWQLEQLATADEETLRSISGVGPKTIEQIRAALARAGLSSG